MIRDAATYTSDKIQDTERDFLLSPSSFSTTPQNWQSYIKKHKAALPITSSGFCPYHQCVPSGDGHSSEEGRTGCLSSRTLISAINSTEPGDQEAAVTWTNLSLCSSDAGPTYPSTAVTLDQPIPPQQ
ncbi:uncharacterized protein LOC143435099 isoform X12 [Arvicanthis niloticus]|uniref:uncharacterized protein LOC143309482 isoform X10 n=1 Tax=Arvicanthis niloticus TaxID=61156 RepID=UPI00402B2D89